MWKVHVDGDLPSTDVGQPLENVIYLELIRRGYDVYIVSTRSPFVSETEGISETELGGLRQLESRLV